MLLHAVKLTQFLTFNRVLVSSNFMATNQQCESGTIYYGRYYTYTVPIGVVAILQLFLLLITIHDELRFRKLEKFRNVRTLRILYIILQLLAISSLALNILLFFVDPHTHILRNTIWCSWVPYLRFWIPEW